MKKRTFLKSIVVVAAVGLAVVSCGFGGASGPVTDDYITNQEALAEQVGKLLEKAGTSADRVEMADVSCWRTIDPSGGMSNYMSVKMVAPSDKNKMQEYTWMDTEGMRNHYDVQDLIMTEGLIERDVVEGYDNYKDMLFAYADIKPCIDNMAALCREAEEASGYKDKAFVKRFDYSKDSGASITVAHRDYTSLSKRFKVTADGKHIEK